MLAYFVPQIPARASDIAPYDDGRLVVILTTNSGTLQIYDITEPMDVQLLATIESPSGTHTVAVVPGTPSFYDANAVGSSYYQEVEGGRSLHQTEIYDLTGPENPVLVEECKTGTGATISSSTSTRLPESCAPIARAWMPCRSGTVPTRARLSA